MSVEMVLSLLGGLALFLYGMQMMSSNLENVAGGRMKDILERLTKSRLRGVLVGAGITAVIQSSSATTVMVVGFVNAGLMSLSGAVGVIMGANIGTTITGQLVALDIGVLAPLLAFLGVAPCLFIKGRRAQNVCGIVAGLGILFIGMNMMSAALTPLRDNEAFVSLMTRFSNPILGIAVGALFTAVIQSSSASVGILQALAMGGLIGLDGAVYVLFGQNIGTCITAVLAAVGTNRNAKRTTLIHLMFNVIGTIVFTVVCQLTPFTEWMSALTPGKPAAQIANVHTVFNVTTTLLLLPFAGLLAKLASRILPDQVKEDSDVDRWFDSFFEGNKLGASAMAIESLSRDVQTMLRLAAKNVSAAFEAVQNGCRDGIEAIERDEEDIDLFNSHLSQKASRVLALELGTEDVNSVQQIYKITGNVERIGDHAMNIAQYAQHMRDKKLHLSDAVQHEISEMESVCRQALEALTGESRAQAQRILGEEQVFEQRMDDTNRAFRQNQLNRLAGGVCSAESAILYSEMLTDYERIGDHILNIAEAYAQITAGK
jgi:phosphate:Na+ symporter